MKVLVLYYSTYGHINLMAQAIAEGAREVAGSEVVLRRVPETLPNQVLEQMGAVEAQGAFSDVPYATVAELAEADAIIFGTPTRFGNMAGQMRQHQPAITQLLRPGRIAGRSHAITQTLIPLSASVVDRPD